MHDFSRFTLLLLMGFGLSALLAAAGGYVFARRVLRPVSELAAAAGEIGATDLERRLPTGCGPHDELTDLAKTFNDMLARLERGFERERAFADRATHELLTPLTRMRSEIELALRRVRRENGDASREPFENLLAEVEDMTAAARQLLLLSRLERIEAPQKREWTDLSALCHKHAHREREAERRGLDVRGAITPQVLVQASRVHLEEVLDNLLSNALKYTPVGGAVTLTLSRGPGGVHLAVRDTGVGLSGEEVDRLFERFYRSDRSAVQSQAGSGLGLAIVKQIVEAYDGTVEATSGGADQGSCFDITLPGVSCSGSEAEVLQARRVTGSR